MNISLLDTQKNPFCIYKFVDIVKMRMEMNKFYEKAKFFHFALKIDFYAFVIISLRIRKYRKNIILKYHYPELNIIHICFFENK